MKEKEQNDILFVSENRKIKPLDKTPLSSASNLNTTSSINPKNLTYNKLIGRRGKYNKNELLITSEKNATFTIICEKPANNGDKYYNSSNNNGKCCGNNCFGIFGNNDNSSGNDPSNNICYNISLCFIFLCMVVFMPLGILLFLLFYLCTKDNKNMWK